jgi:hypothetical protein
MDKGRKFQPWILGGLSMATFAIAISVGWTQDIAPNNLAPAPAPAPASAPTLAVAQMHNVTPPIVQHRQIWECTINGQKTFSDYRCGDKASLREIGPINIMDPTPADPRSRSYVQESSGQPSYSDASQQADSYPTEQPSADDSYPADDPNPMDDSYPMFIGNPFGERRRPDHEERRRSDHEDRPRSHDGGGLRSRRN